MVHEEEEQEQSAPLVAPRPTRSTKPSAAPTSSAVKQGKRRAIPRSSTPPPQPSSSGPSPSTLAASPSIAIKFAGKVYRTLDTQLEGVTYDSSAGFLGEPDEEVGDAERERADARRREVKRMMLLQGGSPGSSGGKGKRRVEIGGDESDEERLGAEKKRGRTMATPVKQQLGPPLSLSPPRAPQFSATAAGAPPALGLPFAPASSSSALPQPLADLVSLHSAIEGALIMHLSTAGSSLAASSNTSDADAQGRKTIRMPNLIEMAELGRMVNSGGRQFGQKELERLVWAWQLGVDEDEEDELRVVAVEEGDAVGEEVGGLGFLVSRKRVASKGGNGIQSTYGIGLTVKLKTNPQLPQFELVAPVSPSSKAREAPASPSSVGRGREGMSVVALWTQGKSARREELVRNLKAWARKCAREEQAQTSPVYDPNLASVPVQLPPIPRATLPTLSPSLPSIPGTLSPSPKKKVPSHDVFGPAVPIASPSQKNSVLMLLEGSARSSQGKKKETASERNRALRERIAARAEAPRPTTDQAFLSALTNGFPTTKRSLKPDKSANEMQTIEREMYKRNAMISRLGNVADVVVMLSLKCAGRPVLLHEVSAAVSNSPLVKIGHDEAHDSLLLLCELFPTFSHIKSVDRQDWLYLHREARSVEVKRRVADELEAVRRK